ncbi:hypothetical protein FHT03_001093 [Xanthomonas arboricola]
MDKEDRYAEIRFVDASGAPADPNDASQGEPLPVIAVEFETARDPARRLFGLMLVDTGCDYTHAAPTVFDNAAKAFVRATSYAGVTGKMDSQAHDCTFHIPMSDGTSITVHADVIRSPGIDGCPYFAILGRNLLRQGKLILDYRRGIFRIYFD